MTVDQLRQKALSLGFDPLEISRDCTEDGLLFWNSLLDEFGQLPELKQIAYHKLRAGLPVKLTIPNRQIEIEMIGLLDGNPNWIRFRSNKARFSKIQLLPIELIDYLANPELQVKG